MQGTHIKHIIPEKMVQSVRDHINSSHYCRTVTSIENLDLSVDKLYGLYKGGREEKSQNIVKLSYYREIFCNEFSFAAMCAS